MNDIVDMFSPKEIRSTMSSSLSGDSESEADELPTRLSSSELERLALTCAVDGCGVLLASKSELLAHARSAHRGDSARSDLLWRCYAPGCHKTYTRKGNLQAHVQQQHERVQFECEFAACGKVYYRRAHLKRHVQAVHLKVTHPCAFCGAIFRYKHVLDEHVRATHAVASDAPVASSAAKTAAPVAATSNSTATPLPARAKRKRAAADSLPLPPLLLPLLPPTTVGDALPLPLPLPSLFDGVEPPPALPVFQPAPLTMMSSSSSISSNSSNSNSNSSGSGGSGSDLLPPLVRADLSTLRGEHKKRATRHDDVDASRHDSVRRAVSIEGAAVLAVFEQFLE
jgi:hypothetical protein